MAKCRNFVSDMGKDLLFCTSTELVRIPCDAMVYVTAGGNYSTITMVDGCEYVLTVQLGQIEQHILDAVAAEDNHFIRIGKSLIINSEFVTFINPAQKKLILSDCRTFKHELSASREALKALKDFLEKEAEK